MDEIKFYAVEALPALLSPSDDGIYFVKSGTSIIFKYYVVSKGKAYEIDAISLDKLIQALSTKFDKPNGTQFQYIKGDGTYGLMNKEAVGLVNVDNTSDLNKPISTATQNALNNKADDNKVVHIEGYELITGDKEFSKHVLNPTYPTDPTHLVNKMYVDDVIVGLGVDNTNSLKKNENNIVTENFSIERRYGNGDSFTMDVRSGTNGYGEMSIGVSDDNAEGVRFLFSRDNIKMRGVDGGIESMVMDGDKITFAQYSPNKVSNDVPQMQDLENLKQWVVDNYMSKTHPSNGITSNDISNWNTSYSWGNHSGKYLSLNGGTVNGDIFANKFEEN